MLNYADFLGIRFDFGTLISFLFGLFAGLLIFFLIYVYAMIKSFNVQKKVRLTTESDITALEINKLIEIYQQEFKQTRKSKGYGPALINSTKMVCIDITSKYFPKSKYPYLELSIDETFLLGHYILDRLDEIVGKSKLTKSLRGMTIKRIFDLINTKNKIENSTIIQDSKGFVKVANSVVQALNVINPVYWGRKLIVDNLIKVTMNQIGLVVIKIAGDETYKVYSKKVFNEEVEMKDEDFYQTFDDNIIKELKDETKTR